MKIFLVVVLLQLLYVSQAAHISNSKPKIALYFEALCPGCNGFITQALYPGYQKIGSYLEIDFVPYGNTLRSQENGTWVFDCQHGEEECLLNKLEACGLVKSNDQDKKVEFIYCIEKQVKNKNNDMNQLSQCATKLDMQPSEVLKCANGPEGNKLLAELADKTEALNPSQEYVPWITVNGKHDQDLATNLWENFVKTVCSLLSIKPAVCN